MWVCWVCLCQTCKRKNLEAISVKTRVLERGVMWYVPLHPALYQSVHVVFTWKLYTPTVFSYKESTHKGVNWRSKYVTQIQQQRPKSPMATPTWHACKYKVQKFHQRYIRVLRGKSHLLLGNPLWAKKHLPLSPLPNHFLGMTKNDRHPATSVKPYYLPCVVTSSYCRLSTGMFLEFLAELQPHLG